MTVETVVVILSILLRLIFGVLILMNVLAYVRVALGKGRASEFIERFLRTVSSVTFLLVLSDTEVAKYRIGPYR
jgi:hypothetical protein